MTAQKGVTKPATPLEPKPHGFTITYEVDPTPAQAARWLNACREKHRENQKKKAA
jgi:hypothetical protein